MRAADQIFGTYRPTGSPLEKATVGAKYALVLALSVPAVVVGRWWFSLAAVAAGVAVLVLARVGVRRALRLGLGMYVLCGLIVAVHALSGAVVTGVVVVLNLVLALYATRILTLTTPIPDLVDGIVAACGPLRRFGVDPDSIGLAVAVMMRSLPQVIGAFQDVRDAADARGIGRNPVAYVAPVVVRTVAYAHATGDALAARGLGEAHH
jgi:biotin transport system permease protein